MEAPAPSQSKIELFLEICNGITTPVRLLAGVLFAARYIFTGFTRIRKMRSYATGRYGKRYYWRPWLLFDVEQLENLEYLINYTPDDALLNHRRNQQESIRMVSIVGALMAGVSVSSLQIPGMASTSSTARGSLICALVVAILTTFFCCLIQQTYFSLENPRLIRAWLSNGTLYTNSAGEQVLQSSILSERSLHMQFELLCLCITSYLVGIGIFTGISFPLSTQVDACRDEVIVSNPGALTMFSLVAVLALLTPGLLVGGKETEEEQILNNLEIQEALDRATMRK